jgi:hypothetical protein
MDAEAPQGKRYDTLPAALKMLEEHPDKCVKYTFPTLDIVVIVKYSGDDEFSMFVGTSATEPGEWEELKLSRRDVMVRIYLTRVVEDRAVEALSGGLADEVEDYLAAMTESAGE